MNAAAVSLGALLVEIVVSCTIRLHVGFLAIALAWITGVYVSGMSANEVMAGFPTRLFLTLAGVTLLFSQAQANGTLDRIAHQAVRYCRGNVGVMPMMFFVLAFVLASVGPGNIASTALVAPMAMAVAGQVRIPAFLMAIMVGNGANAGSLSPIASTGVIVNRVMADIGLDGFERMTYLNNMLAHVVIAFLAYFLLGGWRLLGRYHSGSLDVPLERSVSHDVGWRQGAVRLDPLDHHRRDREPPGERHSVRRQHRAWRVCRSGSPLAPQRRRRARKRETNALAGHHDGLRRHRADLCPG